MEKRLRNTVLSERLELFTLALNNKDVIFRITAYIIANPRQLHVSAAYNSHLHAVCVTKYKNKIM
jgi:hypothetical protein